MDARRIVAAAAEGIAGLSYSQPTRADYLELVAPLEVEGPQLEDEMGHMWSCALTVMGLWRKVGISHRLLTTRYEIEKAMAWVSQIGQEKGAEVYPGDGRMPDVGDAVEVNRGTHVVAAIVSARLQSSGLLVCDTIEGGQVDLGGNKCIKRFSSKSMRYAGGELMLGAARVFRWYDCTMLGVPIPVDTSSDPAKPQGDDPAA